MPVNSYIDREGELILTCVSADATIDEILRENAELSAGETTTVLNGIVFFEDLNRVVGDAPSNLRRVSQQLNQFYGPEDTSKTAFVVTKDVDYGLLRIYTTYRGRDTRYFQMFFELTEALEWIGVEQARRGEYLAIIERLRSAP